MFDRIKVIAGFKARQTRRPVKLVALKAFCALRVAQRRVQQLPHKGRAVLRDLSDAWRESGRIVPN